MPPDEKVNAVHGDNCASWHGWPNQCNCGAAPGTTQAAPVEIILEATR